MAKSIAGNVHGAKAAAAQPQTKRYYPPLEGVEGIHPEVARSIRTLNDNVYQLRGDQQTAAKGAAATSTDKAAAAVPNQFTGDLQGIKIAAATDPSSLKDGMVAKYNAKTGQFEFKLP